jgi:mannose-6-phosphate isomerase-like protein (cupin superfamily)
MDYVRPVDFGAFTPDAFHSQVIGSFESMVILCSRVPPGLPGPALHVHPSDQLYYTLRGRLKVQLGEEMVEAKVDDLVFIPAGLPHRNLNEEREEEVHFELIAPAARAGRPLSAPAADASSELRGWVRSLGSLASADRPFQTRALADPSLGSRHVQVRHAQVQPRAAGPGLHIHECDQVYYVIEGTMELEIALKRYTAGPNTVVMIPAGVPHRNWNEGTTTERHLAMLAPPDGESPIRVSLTPA